MVGASGAVSFLFDFRSIFAIENGGRDEDALMELALEAGAEDVEVEEEFTTIYGAATDFISIKLVLEGEGIELVSAETGYVPRNWTPIQDKAEAARVLRLIDALEENDDVRNVYANYDISEQEMARIAG